MDPFLAMNRDLWDEWTAIHEGSAFYDLASFRDGRRAPGRLRAEDIGDRRGPVAPASAVSLRHRHAVVRAPGRRGDRRRLLAAGGRVGGPARGRSRAPRAVRGVEPVRPPPGARRRLRHRLHVARGARVAPRHPWLGAGGRRVREAGRDLLHHRSPPRGLDALRRSAAARALPVLGARGAADVPGGGLLRGPHGPRWPRPSSTRGTTAMARSSRP